MMESRGRISPTAPVRHLPLPHRFLAASNREIKRLKAQIAPIQSCKAALRVATGCWVCINARVAIRSRALALVLIAFAITTSSAAADSGHNTPRHRRCLVPDVRGFALGKAERALRTAHCVAGRVIGPRGTRVGAQSPKRGARERAGWRVALVMRRPARAPVAPKPPVTTGSAGAATLEPVGIPGNWKLVLDSEFNGSSLNTNLWRVGWT